MKKPLLLIMMLVTAFGCSKSSNPTAKTAVTATTGFTGKYVSYKILDTAYNNSLKSDGIETITLYSAYGDTVYQHPNTPNYVISPGIIENYDPSWATIDTVIFSSSGKGKWYYAKTDTSTFTYDLKTGAFHGDDDPSSLISKIVGITDRSFEVISYEADGAYTGDVHATYFRKL